MKDKKIHVLDLVDPETKQPVKLVMAEVAFLKHTDNTLLPEDNGKSSDEILKKLEDDDMRDEDLLFHSAT